MKAINTRLLKQVTPEEILNLREMAFDEQTYAEARVIVEDVKLRGKAAVIKHAVRLRDMKRGDRLVYESHEFCRALLGLESETRAVLERTIDRIRLFAEAQLKSLTEFSQKVPGGEAGQVIVALESAGCYVPGGRYPLISSLLMGAVTAKAAGVKTVIAATPRPDKTLLAAAAMTKVDLLLAVGGAQAIAALAYGVDEIPRCDIVVGPGNRWVTAAKHFVSRVTGIDMLAGPSELVIVADASAKPEVIAADLLAQAEHDNDALPVLITTSEGLLGAVENQLKMQLKSLPSNQTACIALGNGCVVLVSSVEKAAAICNKFCPEHLGLQLKNAAEVSGQFRHYGTLFVGACTAEVFGDYGVGPNHILPTGGSARSNSGLSVLTFLNARTWIKTDSLLSAVEAEREFRRDVAYLARLEGLEAHARSSEVRLK